MGALFHLHCVPLCTTLPSPVVMALVLDYVFYGDEIETQLTSNCLAKLSHRSTTCIAKH